MTTYRLAHLSDPHLPPPPSPFRVGDVVSKRLLSRFAWRRKRHRHQRAVLDAITADVAGRQPDHTVITGDLINFATPEEFRTACAWLETLGPSEAITVAPGNHDALAASGAPAGFSPWRPWLSDTPAGDFPHLRRRGPVAIISLSSAVPTAIHLAQGSVGAAQIQRARAHLRTARAEGLYRIVLVHHPVAAGVVSKRKAMTDAADLRTALQEDGAELILHGHAHEALLTQVPGPAGAIPAIGVPSASTPTGLHDQPARWNEIEIVRDGDRFRTLVRARGITADLTVEALGSYELA